MIDKIRKLLELAHNNSNLAEYKAALLAQGKTWEAARIYANKMNG